MELKEWLDTELGQDIWKKKYQNNGESFDQWLVRITNNTTELIELVKEKKFLFGGRILANRGVTDRKVTYSNCYVLAPPEDNIESIYDTASKLARTFSYGGGCGIDISKLRPRGYPVNNAAKTTTGAVSFMETFNQVSKVIGQAGRRGALMISMDCHHPDIEEFINVKKNTDKLEDCNISIMASDDFMTWVTDSSYNNVDEYASLFKQLAENNWNYGEPGILYWDTIKNNNLLNRFENFEFAGVNPCAEQPLPAGGSCLLGAINLAEFVEEEFTDKAAFNLPEFRNVVEIAVKALNDVLDEGLELHPLQQQKDTVRDWRQIGLGIMGFADMLIKIGIPYGSERCLELIGTIGKEMVKTGVKTSIQLAVENGSFNKCEPQLLYESNFAKSTDCFGDKETFNDLMKYGMRNSQLFTIAPTGSISTMIGVSGGVEPIFQPSYTRTTKSLHEDKDVTYTVVTPIVQQCLKAKGTQDIPPEVVWSKIIDPFSRVKTQAAWQQYIDASISSTVNLPKEATVELIQDLYILAWTLNCKGLTIFREGCARDGILNPIKQQPEPTPVPAVNYDDMKLVDTSIEQCTAMGTKLQTGCGSLWVTVYFHNETGQLCHIFLNKGSKGGCNSYMNSVSRMISLAGKKGASIEEIVDQLNSVVTCPSYAVAKKTKIDISPGNCCASAIGIAIKDLHLKFMEQLQANTVKTVNTSDNKGTEVIDSDVNSGSKCPECGELISNTGGCNICLNCGYTKCD